MRENHYFPRHINNRYINLSLSRTCCWVLRITCRPRDWGCITILPTWSLATQQPGILWLRKFHLEGRSRIRIRTHLIRWILIRIRINLQMKSQNLWKMSLLEHFFKVFWARIRIRIRKCIQSEKLDPGLMRICNTGPKWSSDEQSFKNSAAAGTYCKYFAQYGSRSSVVDPEWYNRPVLAFPDLVQIRPYSNTRKKVAKFFELCNWYSPILDKL